MEKFVNQIHNADCLELMRQLPDKSIDLILTDPPYLIKNTRAGGKSKFAKTIQKMNDELVDSNLDEGVTLEFCEEIVRLQDKINCYIWCNKEQILDYLNFFVGKHGCSWQDIEWFKTNAMPTFSNKYLTDKEYCLYFRRGGYCMPKTYEKARTAFFEPINKKDKDLYFHPTIKPLKIFETLIDNSSREGEIVLDCFSGSGTTAVACHNLNRRFICIEKSKVYAEGSKRRLEEARKQLFLFGGTPDMFKEA